MNNMMIWLISRFNWYCNNVVWWLCMWVKHEKFKLWWIRIPWLGDWVENAELNAKLKLWNWREEPYWLVISETAKQIEKKAELFNELMEMWECKLYSYKTIIQSIFLVEPINSHNVESATSAPVHEWIDVQSKYLLFFIIIDKWFIILIK